MTEQSHAEKKRGSKPCLKVDSFAELMKHEKEILARIERTPNGGHLFLIHPFMLLRDIGVELSQCAEQEIRQHEPRLTGLSAVPYHALKNSKEKQRVRFHLRGLFERSEKP
ncbi:MAG: hypothetical protein HZB84_00805 [Deltaproteobacteria bacterium]|nr:hypothetical protein [Deltaproteobacteria bacterium]